LANLPGNRDSDAPGTTTDVYDGHARLKIQMLDDDRDKYHEADQAENDICGGSHSRQMLSCERKSGSSLHRTD
jgi:hypothetical protein